MPLAEVIGQERAVGVLERSLASGRLHHAWIFHGPAGVGKMTTALAFASVLLDPSAAPDLTGRIVPDPESETQHLLSRGTHPDLHVIVKELAKFSDDKAIRDRKLTSIPLEVIREHLLEPAALAANRTGGVATKVFIVDEAHLLNGPTQNAVLKTLEEPPAGTVIILVTDSEDRLLPTIRSRCQRVGFAPLSDGAMDAWVARWSAGEGVELSPTERRDMDRLSGNAPGVFVEARDAGMLGWLAQIEGPLGAADRGEGSAVFGSTLKAIVDERANALVARDKQASKDAANKRAASEVLRLIAERYRQRLTSGDPEPALAAIDLVARAEREAAASVNLQFVFDHLAAGLAGR